MQLEDVVPQIRNILVKLASNYEGKCFKNDHGRKYTCQLKPNSKNIVVEIIQ